MDFLLTATAEFPPGTSVGAHPPETRRAGAGPASSAVASATAVAGGVPFTGLEADTAYVAYALVGGEHRYVAFRTREVQFAGSWDEAWRGEWDADETYAIGEVVGFDGASYIAEAEIPAGGDGPDTDDGWGPLTARGAQGAQGPQGVQGVQGATGSYTTGSGLSIVAGQISLADWVAWTALSVTLGNWTEVTPLAYKVDALGFVCLRGVLNRGGATAPTWTMPVGARPATTIGRAIWNTTADATGMIKITAAGAVTVNALAAGNGNYDFSAVRYEAA